MKKVKLQVWDSEAEAASEATDLLRDADAEDRGLWSLGVTFEVDGDEKTIFIALDYDGTSAGAIMAAARLVTTLGTLRTAVDKLIETMAAEAYIDEETLELLTAQEIEAEMPDQDTG